MRGIILVISLLAVNISSTTDFKLFSADFTDSFAFWHSDFPSMRLLSVSRTALSSSASRPRASSISEYVDSSFSSKLSNLVSSALMVSSATLNRFCDSFWEVCSSSNDSVRARIFRTSSSLSSSSSIAMSSLCFLAYVSFRLLRFHRTHPRSDLALLNSIVADAISCSAIST